MKNIAVLACVVAAASAFSVTGLINEEWNAFKLEYNKHYESVAEDKFRMKIFVENKRKIAIHNQRFERGLVSFQLKQNKYADLLHHEFVHTMNGFNKTVRQTAGHGMRGATFLPPANVHIPSEVDWRKAGAVTEIKDQGDCGSCWAFSTTGSLEGQHFLKTGSLVSLSEQNLIDCSSSYGNEGCDGGLMDYAFTYISKNGGIDTESSYPYEAKDDKCRYNPKNSGAEDVGYTDLKSGDEQTLMVAVATVGPISVAIDASQDSFQLYSGGVYYEENCSSDILDHGVLVVGYGTDKTGGDYWLVKNSWGTSWGLQGYIMMSRNRDNNCGIATAASYPLV